MSPELWIKKPGLCRASAAAGAAVGAAGPAFFVWGRLLVSNNGEGQVDGERDGKNPELDLISMTGVVFVSKEREEENEKREALKRNC